MKKTVTMILTAIAVLFMLSSCTTQDDFDREAFLMVSTYADEVIPAVGETLFDLDGWAREPEDEERIEWLMEHAEKLEAIGRRHFHNEFPTSSDIEGWTVKVKRGDNEWLVEGTELLPALEQMKAAAENLIALLHDIAAVGGDLSDREQERVEAVKIEAQSAVDGLHWLFYGS